MSRKPTLFYSKKCQHCAEILNKIRLAGGSFGSNFDYVLIDGNRNLPTFLKEVPTLIVPNYPQPMTGEAVFMWIDTQLRRNASMNQPQASGQRMMPMSGGQPQQQQQQAKVEGAIATNMEGLSFYNAMEMSGFGDSYMSLEGDDNSQEHCFVFIDEKGNKQVQCFPAGQGPLQTTQQQQQQSMERPAWLQPQNVGRQQQQDVGPMKYNPNFQGGSGGQSFHPSQYGTPMTMSQQNNIRMQQVARQVPPMPQFQDMSRTPMNDNAKMTDGDFERYMAMRDSDPRIGHAPQRM